MRRRRAAKLIRRDPLSRNGTDGTEATTHVMHLAEVISSRGDCVAALHGTSRGVHAGNHREFVEDEVWAHERLNRSRRRHCQFQRHGDRLMFRRLAQQKRRRYRVCRTDDGPELAPHVVENHVITGHPNHRSAASESNLRVHQINLHRHLHLHDDRVRLHLSGW